MKNNLILLNKKEVGMVFGGNCALNTTKYFLSTLYNSTSEAVNKLTPWYCLGLDRKAIAEGNLRAIARVGICITSIIFFTRLMEDGFRMIVSHFSTAKPEPDKKEEL